MTDSSAPSGDYLVVDSHSGVRVGTTSFRTRKDAEIEARFLNLYEDDELRFVVREVRP